MKLHFSNFYRMFIIMFVLPCFACAIPVVEGIGMQVSGINDVRSVYISKDKQLAIEYTSSTYSFYGKSLVEDQALKTAMVDLNEFTARKRRASNDRYPFIEKEEDYAIVSMVPFYIEDPDNPVYKIDSHQLSRPSFDNMLQIPILHDTKIENEPSWNQAYYLNEVNIKSYYEGIGGMRDETGLLLDHSYNVKYKHYFLLRTGNSKELIIYELPEISKVSWKKGTWLIRAPLYPIAIIWDSAVVTPLFYIATLCLTFVPL